VSDKVWGFKGEDIFVFEKKGKKHILVERIGDETIQGNLAFELVPVVSVERHERLIKALNKSHLKDTAFLIKLRAKERSKVWKLEKELKAVCKQVQVVRKE